nr:hypothetical protein [Tanacetum cinerariifolium]
MVPSPEPPPNHQSTVANDRQRWPTVADHHEPPPDHREPPPDHREPPLDHRWNNGLIGSTAGLGQVNSRVRNPVYIHAMDEMSLYFCFDHNWVFLSAITFEGWERDFSAREEALGDLLPCYRLLRLDHEDYCFVVIDGFRWELVEPDPGGANERRIEHVAPGSDCSVFRKFLKVYPQGGLICRLAYFLDGILGSSCVWSQGWRQLTRKDYGTKRGRPFNSSSSSFALNLPSSCHHVDEYDDENNKDTPHTSTPSPLFYVSSLSNEIPQDNSLRINRSTGYENQRISNVAGARENVGSSVVQKFRIQCYNCKEFGHVARECQKPKRAKDAAYHREKMLLCKQEEAGIQLNAEQADWRDDTDDDELEDQKLEAHYMYMAQLQEVSPDAADSGPIFDDEPLQKVSNDDHYNVFAMESTHPEQSKYAHDTYPIEQDAQNVIIYSLDMNYDREAIVRNDDDNDLAKERELLAYLIKKLKCEI